jgi:Zn-finger nucleic acid-binding protein
MICPVCKYAMIVVEYHNIELDYCHSCKGVWFDSGELELLLKSHELEEPNTFFTDILNSQEAVSSEKKRNCPVCGRKMKKTAIDGQPEILIDVCRDKHGLWFDGGEVAQLIRRLAGKQPPKRDSKGQVISFLEEVFGASE